MAKIIDIEDAVLAKLVALYRQALLVPFIGSGMSVPVCTGWGTLLKNLARETGIRLEQLNPDAYYRIADMAVARLAGKSTTRRAKTYRKCLRGDTDNIADTHMPALTQLVWPMVVTTNYDDVYCLAAKEALDLRLQASPRKKRVADDLLVLGRTPRDCHAVLRSLDRSGPPIMWAVQGYLGGIAHRSAAKFVPQKDQRRELAAQVVIGHQQYQRAINADLHFRRAFAEVCRRRSFLFLGSGIAEDYLLNLFSEVMHHHGPPPHGHFAMLHESLSERLDPDFLVTRLGIEPVFYGDKRKPHDHSALTRVLTRLAAEARLSCAKNDQALAGHRFLPDEVGFHVVSGDGQTIRFVVCFMQLPPTQTAHSDECWIVSVGRKANRPKIGRQVQSEIPGTRPADWAPVDAEASYVFTNTKKSLPNGKPYVFAVAARSREATKDHHDPRDLGVIPEAVAVVLQTVAGDFATAHLGAVSAGPHSFCHPNHALAQTLNGVRRFLRNPPSGKHILREIRLYVVDSEVWADVVSGRLPVLQYLSSDVASVLVEVRDAAGAVQLHSINCDRDSKVEDCLRRLRLDRKDWHCQLDPPLTEDRDARVNMSDPVLPTMTVRLTANKST